MILGRFRSGGRVASGGDGRVREPLAARERGHLRERGARAVMDDPARADARMGASAAADTDASPLHALRRAERRGLSLLGVVALVGCLHLVFMIGVELDRTVRHRASITALEAELDALAAEAAELRAAYEHADDAAYREQLARSQGFLYPNETRLIVLPTSPVGPASP